jgi:hypothetical protein
VSDSKTVARHLPLLRRYAHALTGEVFTCHYKECAMQMANTRTGSRYSRATRAICQCQPLTAGIIEFLSPRAEKLSQCTKKL